MGRQITLTLTDKLLEQVQQAALRLRLPMEEFLVRFLESALEAFDDPVSAVPLDFRHDEGA